MFLIFRSEVRLTLINICKTEYPSLILYTLSRKCVQKDLSVSRTLSAVRKIFHQVFFLFFILHIQIVDQSIKKPIMITIIISPCQLSKCQCCSQVIFQRRRTAIISSLSIIITNELFVYEYTINTRIKLRRKQFPTLNSPVTLISIVRGEKVG